jgi:hypothetical protein
VTRGPTGCSRNSNAVAAAAAQGPEQIGLLLGAGAHQPAVGGDELDREEIIERKPVLAHEPADAAAEGQSGYPGAGHHAARNGEPGKLRFAIELAPGDAPLHMRDPAPGIQMNTLHGRQVDHHPAVDGGAARHVVAASAHGSLEAQLARDRNGVDHVGDPAASGDEGRALVDEAVVNLARLLVAGIRGLEELAGEGRSELRHGIGDGGERRHGRCPPVCRPLPSTRTGAPANSNNSAEDEAFSSTVPAWPVFRPSSSCRRSKPPRGT